MNDIFCKGLLLFCQEHSFCFFLKRMLHQSKEESDSIKVQKIVLFENRQIQTLIENVRKRQESADGKR